MASSCCRTSEEKSGSKPRARMAVAAAAWRSTCGVEAFTLGAAGELARLGVDPHLVAFFDEERNTDLHAGRERRGFCRAAAGRVAADAGFGRCDDELDVRREDQADRVAVVLLHLDDEVVDEDLAILAHFVGTEGQGLEAFLIHEVEA